MYKAKHLEDADKSTAKVKGNSLTHGQALENVCVSFIKTI